MPIPGPVVPLERVGDNPMTLGIPKLETGARRRIAHRQIYFDCHVS